MTPRVRLLDLLFLVGLASEAAGTDHHLCRGDVMQILKVADAGISRPFGDERTVHQAFGPSGFSAEDADPFLMCDHYARVSTGVAVHEDDFPVDWHPHRGMDILTYMKTGVGRHADSMGNRETFATPGMQWASCGSGLEHAED